MKDVVRDAAHDQGRYDSRPDTWLHIHEVRRRLGDVVERLLHRAHEHDQSKLYPPEVEAFDEATPKLKTLTYGTPEYRESLASIRPAIAHHNSVNSHHPEHYENGIAGMSLLDLIEMLCDWDAASYRMATRVGIIEGIAMQQERFGFTDELRSILENTARELGFS